MNEWLIALSVLTTLYRVYRWWTFREKPLSEDSTDATVDGLEVSSIGRAELNHLGVG